MKYAIGDLVAFGYKIGMITSYDKKDKTYQVEWAANRLELIPEERVGALREHFATLRNLLKLSGYSNGI